MTRTSVWLLALVGALVLAGCLGGGSGAETDTETTSEPATTTAEATTATTTPETTTTATDGGATTTTTDDGAATTTADGDLRDPGSLAWVNGSDVSERRLLRTHLFALGNVSSYAVTWEFDAQQMVAVTTRAQRDPARVYRVTKPTGGGTEDTVEQYIAGGTLYTRQSSGEGYRYSNQSVYRNMAYAYQTSGTGLDDAGPFLWFDLQYRGTVTRDGSTYHRLAADEFRPDARGIPEGATNPSATVLVDRRGVVREFHYEYDTESGGTRSGDFRTTGIGSTSVTPPEWLEEAKDETGE